MKPKPSRKYPDFFEIPGYSRYVTSSFGSVIDTESNDVVKTIPHNSGYVDLVLRSDSNRNVRIGRHRVMGLAFKHPGGCVDDLIVNHLNGVKGDDFLDNLEWTTHQGNIEHAGALGLTTKCIPIEVLDVGSGVVSQYPSAVTYAREVGLSRDAIAWRLRVGEHAVFPEGKRYRRVNDDVPWSEIPTMRNGRSRPAMLRYLTSGVELGFEKLSDMAEHLGVKLPYLYSHTNNPEQPVIPGLIQVRWADEAITWRHVSDPRMELDRTTGNKSVVVENVDSGSVEYFDSVTDCAKRHGLNKTTLCFRLKYDGSKVFDGNRFWYYKGSV